MKTRSQSGTLSGLFQQSYGRHLPFKLPLLLMIAMISSGDLLWSQTSQTPTQTVCVGNEPYLVTASTGSTYTWNISPGTSGTNWLIHGTGNSISVDWNTAGSYTLSVTERNSFGCTGSPVSVAVTVIPTPDVNAVTDRIVANGSVVAAINLTGSVPGTVFNWMNDNPSIGLSSSGTGNITSFTATNSGNVPVVATITITPSYINGGTECTGTARTFTITVNPSTTIDPVANAAYCNGVATSAVTFSSPVAGTTFSWTNSNTSIGLGSSGTGNIPSFTATNNGTTPQIATITVTPYINSVAGNPITFTITVNPLPSTSPIFHN